MTLLASSITSWKTSVSSNGVVHRAYPVIDQSRTLVPADPVSGAGSGIGEGRQRLQVVLRQADVVAPAFHHQAQKAIFAPQAIQG